MKTVTVAEIMQVSYKDIWSRFTSGKYTVIYSDGETEVCTHKSIIYNRYIWVPYETYQDAPILKKCSVQRILDVRYYTAEVHIKLLEAVFAVICEHYNFYTFESKEDLLKIIYHVYNLIFVDYLANISKYVTTIDSIDFVEVVDTKEIKDIQSSVTGHPASIDKAYKDIKSFLVNKGDGNNMFIHAYKSKSINESQANQCIGPRGFVADIDRTVFKQPITSGFIAGMSTLFELTAESRTAAKSLNATDKHIQISEWKSRLMQYLAMSVTDIKYTDCGSTEYYDFLVEDQVTLKNIESKYYLDKETNTVKMILGTETDLIGKIIMMRTVLGCKLTNKHHVCSTCIGGTAGNIRVNSNIGHTFVAYLMEMASQSILSTKHLTHSVSGSVICLTGEASKYFRVKEDKFYLNTDINLKHKSIVLDSKQLPKLLDVLNLSHSHISLEKIGEILNIIFISDNNVDKKITTTVNVQYEDRACILSKDFLDYIRSVDLFSDSRGNYIIPMDKFNTKNPILTMPLKENNVINFVNKLATMVETTYDKVYDPYEKLTMIYSHVTKQFPINIAALEVIVYATTTFNIGACNYSLGRNTLTPSVESFATLNRYRSLAALLATEKQDNSIFKTNLSIYGNKHRDNHPMDIVFDPEAVLK